MPSTKSATRYILIALSLLALAVMGVVFATPLAVVVTALVKHLYVEDTLEKPHAAAVGAPVGAAAAEAPRRG